MLTALIAVRELAREPGATVIYNLITSPAVPEIITEHGGIAVRTRVGHSFIKARMAETNAVFGGEHSGHFYFRDFWFADSGMLAALHVLAALGEPGRPAVRASGRVRPVRRLRRDQQRGSRPGRRRPPGSGRSSPAGPASTFDELDGLTVTGDGWWFNLRPSNTEPLLRLNLEASDEDTMLRLRDEVLGIVRG